MAGGLLGVNKDTGGQMQWPWGSPQDGETPSVSAAYLYLHKATCPGGLQAGGTRLAKITHSRAVELGFKPRSETLLLIVVPQSLSIFTLVPFKTYIYLQF